MFKALEHLCALPSVLQKSEQLAENPTRYPANIWQQHKHLQYKTYQQYNIERGGWYDQNLTL